MNERLKVWALRKLYPLAMRWMWRKQTTRVPWGELEAFTEVGTLKTRIYRSPGGADKSLMVFFHGGAWMMGDLKSYHYYCLELCDKTGCSVLSVDYPLVPEHPFLTGHDGCLSAVHWIIAHLEALGPSSGKLVLAGDSAGGNLSICTYLELGELQNRVEGIISLYPAVARRGGGFPSASLDKEDGVKFRMTGKMLDQFWDICLRGVDEDSPRLQRAFPLHADNLATMPRTLLITAHFDPLRDEGLAFVDNLRANGVEVSHHHFRDQHGFASEDGLTKNHKKHMEMIVDWLG